MVMERFPVSGVRVYRLNICEAIGDHDKCPGTGTLNVDGLKLGPVMCNCDHHRKPEAEVVELPKRDV
jgi:hypothetical protein